MELIVFFYNILPDLGNNIANSSYFCFFEQLLIRSKNIMSCISIQDLINKFEEIKICIPPLQDLINKYGDTKICMPPIQDLINKFGDIKICLPEMIDLINKLKDIVTCLIPQDSINGFKDIITGFSAGEWINSFCVIFPGFTDIESEDLILGSLAIFTFIFIFINNSSTLGHMGVSTKDPHQEPATGEQSGTGQQPIADQQPATQPVENQEPIRVILGETDLEYSMRLTGRVLNPNFQGYPPDPDPDHDRPSDQPVDPPVKKPIPPKNFEEAAKAKHYQDDLNRRSGGGTNT